MNERLPPYPAVVAEAATPVAAQISLTGVRKSLRLLQSRSCHRQRSRLGCGSTGNLNSTITCGPVENDARLAGFKSMELNMAQEIKVMASKTMHRKTAKYGRSIAAAGSQLSQVRFWEASPD